MVEYHVPKVNGLPALDPAALIEGCQRSGLPVMFWGRANSLTLPIGMEPGSAFFLLRPTDAAALDKNGWHTITWEYSGGTLTTPYYLLASARAVTSNETSAAAWLCEFRDRRALLIDHGGEVASSYNVPRPRFDGTDYTTNRYWPDTLNAGVAWTWQEVLDDLWALLPAVIAGASPTLAWYPGHDPYNLDFRGWRVWDAIAAVLECCQSTLALSLAGVFSAVLLGAAQTGLSFAALTTKKVADWDPKTAIHRVRAPEKIRVCFPVRGRADMLTAVHHRWHDLRFYTIDEASGLTGALAGTVLPVIAPLSAEMDIDGTTALNLAELTPAATNLAAKVADRIRTIGDADWQCYHGIRTSVPTGEQIHVIRWRDYGEGYGARTEYITDSSWAVPARIPRVNREYFNEAHLMAKTVERVGVTYPSYISPIRGDRRIPISYQRYTVAVNGALTWTGFTPTGDPETADADAIAISPAGWFPPLVKVELSHDQSWWRISGWPPIMYAVPQADLPAVECGSYGCYTPGRGAGKVYLYDVDTRDYCLQVYSDGSPVLVELVNTTCVAAGQDFLIAHLNRDEEWTVDAPPLVQKMLKAVDCIKPGSTTSTATVQKQGDTGYEDDTAYEDPVIVDNTDCLIFALPGEIFPARRDTCCAMKWIPSASYGLIRRVRVDVCISCGENGEVAVIQSKCGGGGGEGGGGTDAACAVCAGEYPCTGGQVNYYKIVGGVLECAGCADPGHGPGIPDNWIECPAPGGGSGGSGGAVENCDKQDADCDLIVACNNSGRPIAPCGPEEATAFLAPGVKGATDLDCCWTLIPGPFPTRAKATLASKLCSTDETAALTGVTFPNFCGADWPTPTTATNPYRLAGCAGAFVELAPKFTDCTCEWEIVQVQPHLVSALVASAGIVCDADDDGNVTGCRFLSTIYQNILVYSCDDSVCNDTPVEGSSTEGSMVDLMRDLSLTCEGGAGCDGKGLNKKYARICVFCPPDLVTIADDLIEFTLRSFVTDVRIEEGEECKDSCKLRYTTKSICGLWCDSADIDMIAAELKSADVLTGPITCDCNGVYANTRKVYGLCVCDPAPITLIGLKEEPVVQDFHDIMGNGSGQDCRVEAERKYVLVIDCDECVPTEADTVTVIAGVWQLFAVGVYDDGCLKQTQIAACVLAVGAEVSGAVPGFECDDCPEGSGG